MAADPKELVKNVVFDICLVSAILSLVTLILYGCEFYPTMQNMSENILFHHCSPAFTIALVGILIGYFEENHEEPSKLEMIFYVAGGALFLASGATQAAGQGDYSSDESTVMLIFHFVIAGLLIANATLTIYKSYCK